jgi:hypothetical protein
LPLGFYWYCFPSLDALDEAKNFVNAVGQLGANETLWADIEEDDANLVEWAVAFKTEVERLSNRKLRAYYNQDYHDRYPGLTDVFGPAGVWAAHYGEEATQRPFPEAIMHQYTSNGVLPGIAGAVDLNVFFGTLQQFLLLGAAISPEPEPVPPPNPTPTPDPEPAPEPAPTPAPSPQPGSDTILYAIAHWIIAVLDKIKNIFT